MLGLAGLNSELFQSYLYLSPLTLLNFFTFCLVIACILQVGPDEPNRFLRLARKFLHVVLSNRILATIGSNSLLTFSASVILTYWMIAAKSRLAELGPPLVINTLVVLAILAGLYLVVLLDRALRRRFASRQTATTET